MTNSELAAVVREKLREKGCGAFDLVEVELRDEEVLLCGEVPNEAQRRQAIDTVRDDFGLAVVDRMRVNTALWKQCEDEPKHGIAESADEPRSHTQRRP